MACKNCELCNSKIKDYYYDCKIPTYGQWGNICFKCFKMNFCSLGLGRGQKIDALTGKVVEGGSNKKEE
jgi:hypothetical protein